MATKTELIHADDSNFDDTVLQAKGPSLVDFWAPWCGPCLALAPALEAIADQYKGRIQVVKVNVDEAQQTAMAYDIRSIPTLAVIAGGKVAETLVGLVDQRQLAAFVERNLQG